MILKCITTDPDGLLTSGKYYNVYGLSIGAKGIAVLVCGDRYDQDTIHSPVFLPIDFFCVEHPDLSVFWTTRMIKNGDACRTLIGVREIIEDEYFTYNISEGRGTALRLFEHYKGLIDKECMKYSRIQHQN